jgi:hypothetical protein
MTRTPSRAHRFRCLMAAPVTGSTALVLMRAPAGDKKRPLASDKSRTRQSQRDCCSTWDNLNPVTGSEAAAANPVTGSEAAAARATNPVTGSEVAAARTTNPVKGSEAAAARAINPVTGSEAAAARATNPVTGSEAARPHIQTVMDALCASTHP